MFLFGRGYLLRTADKSREFGTALLESGYVGWFAALAASCYRIQNIRFLAHFDCCFFS